MGTECEHSGIVSRKAVGVSLQRLIKAECLRGGVTLPLVVQPVVDGVNLVAWAAGNREWIDKHLLKHGGILFRDFNVNGVAEFEEFIQIISGGLMEYQDKATPRSQVTGNIYTATDYPPSYSIFLHNESSFAQSWPMKIFFYCITPAEHGGETPIADVRKVFERIDPKIRERFIQKKVMYVRNFGSGFGLPWETVFQSKDRATMEEYCRRAGIKVEWKAGNRMKTRQVRPAVAKHPRTGEMVWFNHAAVLHVSTLEPKQRDTLVKLFREEDLPNNTYYGDGCHIEPSVLNAVREAYQQETITFPWQEGDILMLDNMLTAHGRRPFRGPRKVVVGMAEPVSWNEIEDSVGESV